MTGMMRRVSLLITFILALAATDVIRAQCTSVDIMEPGFKFLTSSRGCAPFTVQMQTEYLQSVPGTVYYVDWGDGTPEETFVQTTTDGVVLQHTYPNSPVDCGYDVIIDASNTCNPRGSVTPIETQVIVWTNDVININPQVFRVCQGFAQELQFTDDSDWNCFPRATRENNEPRWIQWIYGTGNAANRIPNITVNSINGPYPYNNPDPLANPIYPVFAPGEVSLPIQVPVTAPADVGKEFEVTLKNWNQCNPYDLDIKDGNPRNPVSGDLVNGDEMPVTVTARVVIVDSPEPDFQTRAGSLTGPVQNTFCIDEDIFFEDLTPGIAGANFAYTWEFYDNDSGTGTPLSTSNDQNPVFSYPLPGVKLVRIRVRDNNAAGNCEAVFERQVFVSPLLQAQIGVYDLANNAITPEFCQTPGETEIFTVRFTDESFGTITADIRWRWEFYDQNGNLFREEPGPGSYSNTSIGPFDVDYQQLGEYQVKLITLDQATGCFSEDTVWVRLFENPTAGFAATTVCEGDSVLIEDGSAAPAGGSLVQWDYDYYNDNTIDESFTSPEDFRVVFPGSGDVPVNLTVTSDKGCIDTITQSIIVRPLPEAVIQADRLSGCSDLEINFQNTSWNQSLPVDYFEWQVNDGSGFVTDSIQRPTDPGYDGSYTRIFTNPGSSDIIYQVRMVTRSLEGCIAYSNVLDITVNPGPAAGFLYTNYNPFNRNCSPQNISFSADASTQALNPNNYQWDIISEGTVVHTESTGTQPTFDYVFENSTNSVQDYQVRLTTSLQSSCFSDSTLTVRINPVPDAGFTIDTLFMGCDAMTLSINSIQKGLPEYDWYMEVEGLPVFTLTGTQDSFDYTFDRLTNPSEVVIRLTTTNLAGCSSAPSEQAVTIPPIPELVAAFTVSSTNLVLPDSTVTITNNSSAGDWEYTWDFGNGETSMLQDPGQVQYSDIGDYIITLTISDGDCMDSFTQAISVVSPPPTVDFIYDPAIGCHPLRVNFESIVTNVDSYFWEFGDGNTSTQANPSHVYITPGTYSVSLSVVGKSGDNAKEVKSEIIEVVESPFAYFEIQPSIVYIPDQPIFTKNLSAGATSFYWDFGDGTVSDEFEPKHYYQEKGVFTVTLRAYNDYCYDSLSIVGAVSAKSAGRVLIPNAFSPSTGGPGGGNGAGENDVFMPLLADVREFRMQIFNRWGEILFEGVDKGWDGYFDGQLCPQDVYVYKLYITFNNGDEDVRVGDVNLIR